MKKCQPLTLSPIQNTLRMNLLQRHHFLRNITGQGGILLPHKPYTMRTQK